MIGAGHRTATTMKRVKPVVKNVLIAVLLVLVLALSVAVVRLENYHYASQVGMCSEFQTADPLSNGKRHDCLHRQQTRTSPLWHLFYALAGD
jgi:hypothetical protein